MNSATSHKTGERQRDMAVDFDFRKGGLRSIEMAIRLVARLLVAKLRGLV
jgi:hypothetical protein